MLIRDLLAFKTRAQVVSIRPDRSLRAAAREMVVHNIGALVVTDDAGELVGVISERDLVRALTLFDVGLVEIPISEVMTRSVITCTLQDTAFHVLKVMNTNRIRHIPVLKKNQIYGVVSLRELDRAYRHLQSQALTDELTGLSNRRHFLQHLRQEISTYKRYGNPFSVALIDIDHFKRVNDTFGHTAGDLVLQSLSDVMGQQLRLIDVAGRLGGEEFAVLFPNTAASDAYCACDRLMDSIRRQTTKTEQGDIRITVSMGLTASASNTADAESILKQADTLMYDAKAAGRDRIVVDAALDDIAGIGPVQSAGQASMLTL